MKMEMISRNGVSAQVQCLVLTVLLTLKLHIVLSQKVPFAEHYDETNKNRAPGDSQWPNQSQNNRNINNSGRNDFDTTSYNNTYRARFEDRDLRDNPDHSVNWLSPNPFANSNGNKNDGQQRGNIPQSNGSRYPTDSIQYERTNQNQNNFDKSKDPLNNYDRQWDPNSRTQTPYDRQRNRSNIPYNQNERGSNYNINSNTVPIDPFTGRRDEDSGTLRSGNVDINSPNPSNYPYANYSGSRGGIPDDFNSGSRRGGLDTYNSGSRGNQDTYNAGSRGAQDTYNSGSRGGGSSNTYNSGTRGGGSLDTFNTGRSYPDVGPRSNYPSNYPGSSSTGNNGSTYYPGGSNLPNNRPSGSNYPSSNYPGSSSYPGSNYPGSNNPGSTYDENARRNFPALGNYPGRGNFDPGYPNVNIWNEYWTTTTYRPTALGVLGRWRPDLQGQQRPEDINQVPQSVYVMTTFGRVQGFKTKLYDGPWVPLPARPGIANVDKVKAMVSSFVGVPYARAPINEGRFRPPRSHPGWQLHQAVEYGPACPQPARFFGHTAGIVQVDEDCLYLNVYSPDVGSGVEGAPFPVIFYIHDGDFIHGASHQFPPHQLVGWYKLVVVTVNFRLGSLGFLSTGDEYSPGNYAMLDLSMALKWVHENIRTFNGDPDRITIVGLGSGAGAAGLLMLSPKTKSMVKNVVALEGAVTADWAAITDQYRVQNTTQLYSFKLGCWQEYETTSWKMVQCLRSRSWQELANLELDPDVGTWPWSPVVDRTFRVPKDDYLNDWKEEDWRFLPDTPHNLLKSGNYPFVKYMTGFSRQSAADLLYANKTIAPNFEVTREWFDEQINLWVKKYNYTLNPEGVFSAIRYAYTYWPDPLNTTHLREEYIDFLSDALYRSPVDETVKLLLARGIQVHTYLLNYTLEGLRLPFWREVPRGMEYYLLSGAPFMDPEFYPERLRVDRFAWTEGDRNMSNFLMTSVANMAYYGQPTPREVLGIYWERATPADLKYLALNGTNNSTIQRNYKQRELTFWSEYMPFVVGRYVPTYPPTTEYWWEPNEPLQIAFWTVSGICLILIVALVACCLLWRTAKKQRDRIYDDLGLGSEPLRMGSMGGDEISEYAETVKTIDSMDSGVKYSHNPDPQRYPSYSTQSTIHNGSQSQPLRETTKDRFPTPMKRAVYERGGRDTPQTQI